MQHVDIVNHKPVAIVLSRAQLHADVDVVKRQRPKTVEPIIGPQRPLDPTHMQEWNNKWAHVIDSTVASNNGFTRKLTDQEGEKLNQAYCDWAEAVQPEYRAKFVADHTPGMKPKPVVRNL